jgi:cytochrome P450
MTKQEVFDNINVLSSAAGETTSSTLSAVLYYLTHNPDVYKKLITEIRGSFDRETDIDTVRSASLSYLKAVIRETFRIHPAVPVGYHRVTPKKGKFIDGRWVPGGVSTDPMPYTLKLTILSLDLGCCFKPGCLSKSIKLERA